MEKLRIIYIMFYANSKLRLSLPVVHRVENLHYSAKIHHESANENNSNHSTDRTRITSIDRGGKNCSQRHWGRPAGADCNMNHRPTRFRTTGQLKRLTTQAPSTVIGLQKKANKDSMMFEKNDQFKQFHSLYTQYLESVQQCVIILPHHALLIVELSS